MIKTLLRQFRDKVKAVLISVNRTVTKLRSTPVNRIAFWVHTPELVNHFEPIWNEMQGVSFDIVVVENSDVQAIKTAREWNCRIVPLNEVLSNRWQYHCLVSNHAGHGHSAPKGTFFKGLKLFEIIAQENVRLQYAAGKIAWNLRQWNEIYDGIMCFGPYHKKLFSEKFSASVIEVGYPRFDRYFNTKVDLAELNRQYNCEPTKKTIVWLPTWTELSSVECFGDEILELTSKYNVIVKLHPLMVKHDAESVLRFRKLGFSGVIEDSRDNLHLYQLADYMLFDYGGPAFGAIYTNKKFILLNVPGAEDHADAGKGSPEFALRKEFTNLDPGQHQLEATLNSDETWERHSEICERLRNVYFAHNYGNSSAIAADAILNREWLKARRKVK